MKIFFFVCGILHPSCRERWNEIRKKMHLTWTDLIGSSWNREINEQRPAEQALRWINHTTLSGELFIWSSTTRLLFLEAQFRTPGSNLYVELTHTQKSSSSNVTDKKRRNQRGTNRSCALDMPKAKIARKSRIPIVRPTQTQHAIDNRTAAAVFGIAGRTGKGDREVNESDCAGRKK